MVEKGHRAEENQVSNVSGSWSCLNRTWVFFRRLKGNHCFTAGFVIAVIGGIRASPKLTGNAPVPDVFHPVEIVLSKRSGTNRIFPLRTANGRFRQRFHFYEPLQGNSRLNGGSAAVAGTYVVGVVLHLQQITLAVPNLYNCLLAAKRSIPAYADIRR